MTLNDLDDIKTKIISVVVVLLAVEFLASVVEFTGNNIPQFGAAIGHRPYRARLVSLRDDTRWFVGSQGQIAREGSGDDGRSGPELRVRPYSCHEVLGIVQSALRRSHLERSKSSRHHPVGICPNVVSRISTISATVMSLTISERLTTGAMLLLPPGFRS